MVTSALPQEINRVGRSCVCGSMSQYLLTRLSFDSDVYLLRQERAKALRTPSEPVKPGAERVEPPPQADAPPPADDSIGEVPGARTLLLTGSIPPESWNKVGTRLIPKLRSANQLSLGVTFSLEADPAEATHLLRELQQILADLNLTDKIKIESR